ncbi:phosphopantetheine-binding protein [Actinomadura sp. ATCC 31491]|uniref:Phosphopantetheine-binding protein n=1 Tax=Actinomadura luzonensis TaxID=2805427 RepID=A0ABT0FSW7_9ACTN|nr:phosphopantetheine-binding protein [Actinomadura luzonensis]MCK2215441.1 phosphopantetheine-binding protein [Actinomadura luzonensis]
MTISQEPLADTVRRIVDEQLNVTVHGYDLGPDDDLWALGMTSLTCMGLMLSIEDAFGVELPEDALKESTFRSLTSITAVVAEARRAEQDALTAEGAA